MRIKKFLKEQAESDLNKLRDADDEFVRRATANCRERRASKKKWIPLIAGSAAAIVLTAGLLGYYLPRRNDYYLEENLIKEESDIALMNAELSEFFVDLGPSAETLSLEHTYDSVSGKTIDYDFSLKYTGDTAMFRAALLFCINPDYKGYDPVELGVISGTIERETFTIEYSVSTAEDSGMQTASYKAVIQGRKEFIVISAEEYYVGEPCFIDVLQEIVQPK